MSYERGEKRHSAKLTEAKVRAILARAANGVALKVIASEHPEVSKVNIHHIINRRRWRWVEVPCPEAAAA